MNYIGLHNKPKAEVHPGHMRTGPEEEEEEGEEEEEEEEEEVQSPRRSCLDVFNCPKMISFEVGFELGE